MEQGPALLCTEGPLQGRRFTITVEGLRIGREPGIEVQIDDSNVSRQHARVLLHNGAVWVQDAGSRNGIFVNGERVPDHKQLKIGDRLAIGGHVFEIAAPSATAAPAPAAPRRAPAPAPAAPKWKIWPFVLAAMFAGGFILCFGIYGWLRDPGPSAEAERPTYSLSGMLETPTGGGTAPPTTPTTPAPSVEQALAVVAGADLTAAAATVPDPPAGVTARELTDQAQVMYDSGRLADARTQYLMALKVDPTCEICRVRVTRIDAETQERIQAQFDAGMRAFDAMQFPQAITAWETVLLLAPDPKDPRHVQAAEYLQKAKDAAGAR